MRGDSLDYKGLHGIALRVFECTEYKGLHKDYIGKNGISMITPGHISTDDKSLHKN